jgi:hypothetical protein
MYCPQSVNQLLEPFQNITMETPPGGDRSEDQRDMNTMSFPDHILLPEGFFTDGSDQLDCDAAPRLSLKPRTAAGPRASEDEGCWERKPSPPMFPTLDPVDHPPPLDGISMKKSGLPVARILLVPRHLHHDGHLKKSGPPSVESEAYYFVTPGNPGSKHSPVIGPNLWTPAMA